jgi:DNA-binding transcriptional LysR family regulator
MNALKGRIVFESDVIASLVRAVIDGIGLSFVPLIYVARDIREKTVQLIGPKKSYWRYRVWLTCHRQNTSDALILALSSSFKDVCDRASG